jgi:hypothetical protein
LLDLFHYVDDCFSWEFCDNMARYEPYKQCYPRKQVELLLIFDYLGIPHEQRKQEWGSSLDIIGFHIDPNAMTFTMSSDSCLDLIHKIREFARPGSRHTFHDFSKMIGWIENPLKVIPLLRPGLCAMYDKMSRETDPSHLISVSNSICRELNWVVNHLKHYNGIYLADAIEWDIGDADLVLYTDASGTGLGIWCPKLEIGRYSLIPHPEPTRIFYYEALAVLSALIFAKNRGNRGRGYRRIVIYTDNQNTVHMFDNLRARPDINPILITASNIRIEHDLQLRVLHIPGKENRMADALSRRNLRFVRKSHPNAHLSTFELPSLSNGS